MNKLDKLLNFVFMAGYYTGEDNQVRRELGFKTSNVYRNKKSAVKKALSQLKSYE